MTKSKFVIIAITVLCISVLGQTTVEDLDNIGVNFYRSGDYDQAFQAFDFSTQLDPQSAEAWFNKGLALGKQGKYDEAIQAFDKAIEINPQFALNFTNDSNSFNPRDDIGVEYHAPASIRSSAWIGIVPSKIPHGSEKECDTARARADLPYYRIKHRLGTITFKAPQKPGSYDIRMFDSDHWGKEIASLNFSVREEKKGLD